MYGVKLSSPKEYPIDPRGASIVVLMRMLRGAPTP